MDSLFKAVCSFTAYCVTEFKTVFCGLIFWLFLFILPIKPNKIPTKYKCFTVAIIQTIGVQLIKYNVFNMKHMVFAGYELMMHVF